MCADPFTFLNPGPLADGDLELVAPHERWVDDLLAACQHPLTRRDAPDDARVTRQQVTDYLAVAPWGHVPGDRTRGRVPGYDFWMLACGGAGASRGNGAAGATEESQAQPPAVRVAGGIALRVGTNPTVERYYGHVGYHVYPPARGRHYAERACRLLLPLARRHGLRTLWITCNPDNFASRRTCERLGMKLVDVVPVPPAEPLYARGDTHKCRYRLEL